MAGVAVQSGVDARTERARLIRYAAAALIVALWTAWAVLTWQNAVRTVDAGQFHQDLASGDVLSYRVTTNIRHDRMWPPLGTGSTEFDVVGLEENGLPKDGQSADGIVYWLGSGVGRERVVPYEAFVAPYLDPPRQALEAGVRPVVHTYDQQPTPDAGAAYGIAAALVMLVALIVQKPRRATRWFWFFFAQTTLGLGLLAYAVAELLLRPSPTVAQEEVQAVPSTRPWPGLAGLALAALVSIALGAVVLMLQGWLGGVLIP